MDRTDRAFLVFLAKRRCAFSLIELITALVILSLLAIFLTSAIQQMQQKAHKTGCLANLRQWGVAIAAYSGERNGELPLGDSLRNPDKPNGSRVKWCELLAPYIRFNYAEVTQVDAVRRSLFACPAEKEYVATPFYCYAMNVDLNIRLQGEAARVRLSTLRNAQSYVVMTDSYQSETLWNTTSKIRDWTQASRRHGGTPNFLYADGRVAPFTKPLVGPADAPAAERSFYYELFYANGTPPTNR